MKMNLRRHDIQASSKGISNGDNDGRATSTSTDNNEPNLQRRLLLDGTDETIGDSGENIDIFGLEEELGEEGKDAEGEGESEGEEDGEEGEDTSSVIQWEDLHGHMEHDAEFNKDELISQLRKKMYSREKGERRQPHLHGQERQQEDRERPQMDGNLHGPDLEHIKQKEKERRKGELPQRRPLGEHTIERPRPKPRQKREDKDGHDHHDEYGQNPNLRHPRPELHNILDQKGKGRENGDGLFAKVKDTVQNLIPDMHANAVFDGRMWRKATFESFETSYDSDNDNDGNVKANKATSKTEANAGPGKEDQNGDNDRDRANKRLEKLLKRPPPAVINEYFEDENVNIGEIFVSLPSLKDVRRCGETLLSLYENARNPLKVYVGLVEQNHPTDLSSCIEEYCYLQQEQEPKEEVQHTSNSDNSANGSGNDESPSNENHCPYRNQISIIQLSSWSAKGPSYARALAQRKLLGNQQFCMSIDAHSKLTKDWDDVSINQWKMIDNEFAVLSNQPARDLEKDLVIKQQQEAKKKKEADAFKGNKKMEFMLKRKEKMERKQEEDEEEDLFGIDTREFERRIYRNCNILFNDYSIPFYFIHKRPPMIGTRKGKHKRRRQVKPQDNGMRVLKLPDTHGKRRALQEIDPADSRPGHREIMRKSHREGSTMKRAPRDFGANGMVEDLSQPLLSYSWSSSFSFSKCHLDTNVPYDNFVTQFFDTESFTRYARMFTRGYDVYTPTTNIVYHDYNPLENLGKTMNNYVKVSWEHSEIERRDSIDRVHTILGIHKQNPENDQHYQNQRGNLGLYGVGKLRTLKELEKFVNINLQNAEGHYKSGHYPTCANLNWVPYSLQRPDTTLSSELLSVSPMDNLYDEHSELDPQPEFPNRKVSRITLSTYYNRHSHNFSQNGPTWQGHWNWNDLAIFSALILSLIAMKKIIDGDHSNDFQDFSHWFTDNKKKYLYHRGKDKKKL